MKLPSDPASRFYQSQDLRLHYADWGNAAAPPLILVHGGGFLPYHIGRFDRAHTTREEARADGAGRPSDYLRRFHYDTLVQLPRALGYLVDLVGSDRVLLGSDHPFWMGDPNPIQIVREADLTAETQRKILGDNAVRLFRMEAS